MDSSKPSPPQSLISISNIITSWLSEIELKTKYESELTSRRLEAEHRIAMLKLDKEIALNLKKAGLLDE